MKACKYQLCFVALLLCLFGGCQGDESHAYRLMLMKGMAEQVERGIMVYDEKIADADHAIQD